MEDTEKYYLELLNKCNEEIEHDLDQAYITDSIYDGKLHAIILAMHTLEIEIRKEYE